MAAAGQMRGIFQRCVRSPHSARWAIHAGYRVFYALPWRPQAKCGEFLPYCVPHSAQWAIHAGYRVFYALTWRLDKENSYLNFAASDDIYRSIPMNPALLRLPSRTRGHSVFLTLNRIYPAFVQGLTPPRFLIRSTGPPAQPKGIA
jgi:hypothetical protein